jgi:hypothetical protein
MWKIVISAKDSKIIYKYSNLLNSLLISNRSWTNLIMNFVIELLESRDFNVILMMINRLIKMHHYVSCEAEKDDTFAEKKINLLINHVWKLHELLSITISDRDSQFVLLVWKTVCKSLKIDVKLLIAFYSKTDAQNEIANQEMKRYLRIYCKYQHNNWSEWLFMIEFVSNVATFAFTELFAFMTNSEFDSRMSFDSSDIETAERLSIRERVLTQKTSTITKKMKYIWDFIKTKLANAQDTQKKYVDQKRHFSFEYKTKNMIWLFVRVLIFYHCGKIY